MTPSQACLVRCSRRKTVSRLAHLICPPPSKYSHIHTRALSHQTAYDNDDLYHNVPLSPYTDDLYHITVLSPSLQSAVVGLNLKAGPNRPDLTIIYLYWSEQKRKISACVAELKSHLVRQIQVGQSLCIILYIAHARCSTFLLLFLSIKILVFILVGA